MTFTQLLNTTLRPDVLANVDQTLYDDNTRLLPALYRASANIGAILGIPRKEFSQAVPVNANSFNAPADCLDIRSGQMIFNRVFSLSQKSYRYVLGKQLYGASYPEYYHFDPTSTPAEVLFAPATNSAGNMEFEYIVKIDPATLTASLEVWGGAYANFQFLVAHEAGIYLFTASEQYEQANFWIERTNQGLVNFARAIGSTQTEIDTMMAQLEQLRNQRQ